eukprot:GEMP01088916.1.p1 GENE.GEMP01088916.1~~GEMP01088916.1.p1  ORF type:complete len:182 (+),score=30.79 GEMP01088916.1:41-547(+)
MGDSFSCIEQKAERVPNKYSFLAPFNVMKTVSQYDWQTCPFCDLKRRHAKELKCKIETCSSEIDALKRTVPLQMGHQMESFVRTFKWAPKNRDYDDNFMVPVCCMCSRFQAEIEAMRHEAMRLERLSMATIQFLAAAADDLEDTLIEKRALECRIAAKENIPVVTRVR